MGALTVCLSYLSYSSSSIKERAAYIKDESPEEVLHKKSSYSPLYSPSESVFLHFYTCIYQLLLSSIMKWDKNIYDWDINDDWVSGLKVWNQL